VGLRAEVASLRAQLEAEKAARAKYARQLESQAVEWMGQVKQLKEYIDSLRSKMPGTTGTAPPPHLRSKAPGGSTAAARQRELLTGLEGDWAGAAPLFDDDADFVAEVAAGEATAPGMDVQTELERLRAKHEAWNRQFKERLREAQAALRRGGGGAADSAAGGAGGGPGQGKAGPAAVDVRRMPDLLAPDLLDGSSAAAGEAAGGRRRRAGLLRGLLG
jgi:hypothetical protein